MNEVVAEISQPSKINIPLFLHQLKSIESMERLESEQTVDLIASIYIKTRLGVLSDLPGYGKSLSVLGMIGRTLDQKIDNTFPLEKTRSFQYVSQTKVEMLEQVKCSLILVNISLMAQWTQELNRTLLRYIAVYNRTEIEEIDITSYDVILVSNTIYNLFAQVYKKKAWKRFIVDEPASLKISAMEESHALFYWLITSTPNELYLKQRRTGFLNDLLPDDNDLFTHLVLKNEDQFVKSSYAMPLTRHLHYKCSGNISSLFEGLVSDTIIEMLQAGHISGVFHALDYDGVETDSTIIDAYKGRKRKRLLELNSTKEVDEKTLEKIETIDSHLTMLDEKIFKYVIGKNCILCNQSHVSPAVLSCCQNIFCGKCVNDACPLCKTPASEFKKIPLTIKELQESVISCAPIVAPHKNKIDTIMDIIGDAKDKKILIFSNYNESFTLIKKFLEERKLVYLELRGTKEKRDNTIDSYKTGSVNILLLNTIHSGAGLNLPETSDIILYHHIHEFQKIQVLGRANRIGRKIPLTVHYL
jgi:SNF2 family DNA or RNA helicase